MKKFVAIAAFFAASVAHAQAFTSFFEVEAGAGVTHYSTTDGRWYQQGIPGGSNVLRTNAEFSLGLTGPIVTRGAWGVDWHADYVNLGRAAADCNCTPMDENYDPHKHQYVKKFDVPMAYFSGAGRSQGVVLSVEPYYWWNGLRWGVEAGAYVHHDSWNETIDGWQVVGSGAPQNITSDASYLAVAPVAGVSVGTGRVTLSYRHYFMSINSKRQNTPPLWNDADVLELKVKF